MKINLETTFNNLILFLFFFAPFISLLIFNITTTKLIVLLPQLIREFSVLLVVVLFFLSKDFWKYYRFIGILLIGLISISIISIFITLQSYNLESTVLLSGILNNLRRFLFLFVILIYFLYIIKHKNSELIFTKIVTYLYIFWIFGFITYFLPDSFWYLLKLNYYWSEIMNTTSGSGATHLIEFTQSGKMYTHDTYYLFGFKAKRLISFYLEPTTTGSLAIGSLFIAYIFKIRKLLILTVISGLLIFSKAFYLALFSLFLFHLVSKISSKLRNIYNKIFFLILFVFLLFAYYLYLNTPILFEFGFFNHLIGLYSYINNFLFFGYGLGLTGSFSIIDNPLRIGIESSFANIFSQLGVPALLIIFLYFQNIANKIKSKTISLMIIIYFFIYLTSNSATGYSGNFLIIFIFAYIIKLQRYGVYIK